MSLTNPTYFQNEKWWQLNYQEKESTWQPSVFPYRINFSVAFLRKFTKISGSHYLQYFVDVLLNCPELYISFSRLELLYRTSLGQLYDTKNSTKANKISEIITAPVVAITRSNFDFRPTPKLNNVAFGQYSDGWPLGNTRHCIHWLVFFFCFLRPIKILQVI